VDAKQPSGPESTAVWLVQWVLVHKQGGENGLDQPTQVRPPAWTLTVSDERSITMTPLAWT
jgi:hypothetical protein